MNIKFKQVDTTIIVVIEGNILTREVPDTVDFVSNLRADIDSYNSGKLDVNESMFLKSDIIVKMKPKPEPNTQVEMDFIADKELVEEETENIALKGDLEKAKRIADISGNFEYDEEGKVYLEGFSVPIPVALADALLDAKYNPESEYTVQSLTNFWQWAVLNPNPKARIDLFSWFKTGEFVITEQGLIVAYRNVNVKREGISVDLEDFVNEAYIEIKRDKKKPKKYAVVSKKNKDSKFKLISIKKEPDVIHRKRFKGLLSDLYNDVSNSDLSTVYTDNHTGTMNIKMGEEVSMLREDCDENHQASCSRGLHFMSPSYGLRLGNTTVIVLVNPYNIVAFPSYDQTKGRCCAYLPIGKAQKDENGKIIELKNGSYDFEYSKYTSDALKNLIENGSLEDLQKKGLICAELTEKDFNIVKTQVSDIIKSRVINV